MQNIHIHELPQEMMRMIIALLQIVTYQDVVNVPRVIRLLAPFADATEVHRMLNLELFNPRDWWRHAEADINARNFYDRCLQCNNPYALLRLGIKFFAGNQDTNTAYQMLSISAGSGLVPARYVWGLICLSQYTLDAAGFNRMLSTFDDFGEGPDLEKTVTSCRLSMTRLVEPWWAPAPDFCRKSHIIEQRDEERCTCGPNRLPTVKFNPWGNPLDEEESELRFHARHRCKNCFWRFELRCFGNYVNRQTYKFTVRHWVGWGRADY